MASGALGALGTVAQGQQQQAALRQQAAYEAQRQAIERQSAQQQRDVQIRQNRERSKRALAATRAGLAGQGVSANTGSGAAIVRNLLDDTQQQEDDIITAFNNRFAAMDLSHAETNRSLLDTNRVNPFSAASGILDNISEIMKGNKS